MSIVALQRAGNPFEATLKALEATNFKNAVEGKKLVLIKPNLTTSATAQEGITTDPRVVEGILHALRECDVGRIVIGESSGGSSTLHCFQRNGYIDLAKKWRVELLDLDEDDSLLLKVPNPLSISELRISKKAHEADFRISVAKLKIHSLAVATACLKNMMGCLSGRKWKIIVHSDVQNRIVDLNKLILPHFGVVDVIVGNQVDEVVPYPIQMNAILAGKDVVAIDSVAAECMGVSWREVPYLLKAEQAGLGTADLDKIEVIGERIRDMKKTFDRRKSPWALIRTRFQVAIGKTIGTLSSK